MVLVFTHKITPRVRYIFKHIFQRMLGVEVELTTKVEQFIAHKAAKMSYTRQQLGNELFVRSHELLFEQGISDLEIKVQSWEGLPAFFAVGDKSKLPFDIFAASFFLLSRYEEYYPFMGDAMGRFPVEESLAFKNDFLELPLVDLWVQRFRSVLLERFPETELRNQPSYRFQSLIEVPCAFVYRKKGFLRTIAGTFLDLFQFKFRKVFRRYATLLGLRRDPGDNFSRYTVLHRQYQVEAIFFFLVSDFSAYDHPISFNINAFRELIKNVADYDQVALLGSYDGRGNIKKMTTEKQRLQELIHKKVAQHRCHFNSLTIPENYRAMVEAEITEDYSMSYAQSIGFRASTCTPFLFYDIGSEMQLPVKVFSPCACSTQLHALGSIAEIEATLERLHQQIVRVEGLMALTFRNTTLSNESYKKGWRELYIETLKKYRPLHE